jgi:hypothetical protein
MPKHPSPKITRPIVELCGPAILLQELVAAEGVDRVMRAVERGLPIYDATTAFMVQRPEYDIIAEGRFDPGILAPKAA